MSIEDHRNPDGTYNGIGAMSEVTGLSRDEILAIAEQIKANHAKLDGCPWHEFEQSKQTAVLRSITHQRYACRHCGGEIDWYMYHWHQQGRRPMPVREP